MNKSKLYSRMSKEVVACVLVIIVSLIMFLIFPNKVFYDLFIFSLLGCFVFLYFTYIRELCYKIKKKELKTRAEVIIRIIYLIVFSLVVVLFCYSVLSIL